VSERRERERERERDGKVFDQMSERENVNTRWFELGRPIAYGDIYIPGPGSVCAGVNAVCRRL
jgi:hypothetical protein